MTYSLTGVGGVATPVDVVEYDNPTLDHYFITWIAAEQANLDAGTPNGASCGPRLVLVDPIPLPYP